MNRAPALYLITDRRLSDRPLAEQVERALAGAAGRGVAVQLREKDLGGRDLYRLGLEVAAVCRRFDAPLLVNDRIDVARALGAGVHLGGESLPAAAARSILGPEALIGVSTHGPDDVAARAPGADFGTYGPVFFTASKAAYGPPVGFAGLEAALAVGIPLVALGGVAPGNAGDLARRGFVGCACIGAVFGSRDPGAAAIALLDAWSGERR